MTPAPDINDLIAEVQADAESTEPLDRLAAAAAMAGDLTGLADQLIGHYVDEARHAGASWADIGAEIGVTKQAAHQRHLARGKRHGRGDGDVFPGRFRLATDRFKQAIEKAHEAADEPALRHGCVGTEHLLLGVLAVPEGAGAVALANLGVTVDAVRSAVEAGFAKGAAPAPSSAWRLPFSPRAKRVLHNAHRTARRERCRFLGTEHIVMALADGEGAATDILREVGATPGRVRDEVYGIWGRHPRG